MRPLSLVLIALAFGALVVFGWRSMVTERAVSGETARVDTAARDAACRQGIAVSAPVVTETRNPRDQRLADLTLRFNMLNAADHECWVRFRYQRTTRYARTREGGEEIVFGEGRVTEISRFLGTYGAEDLRAGRVPSVEELTAEGYYPEQPPPSPPAWRR
jgi:hypothetical protein